MKSRSGNSNLIWGMRVGISVLSIFVASCGSSSEELRLREEAAEAQRAAHRVALSKFDQCLTAEASSLISERSYKKYKLVHSNKPGLVLIGTVIDKDYSSGELDSLNEDVKDRFFDCERSSGLSKTPNCYFTGSQIIRKKDDGSSISFGRILRAGRIGDRC